MFPRRLFPFSTAVSLIFLLAFLASACQTPKETSEPPLPTRQPATLTATPDVPEATDVPTTEPTQTEVIDTPAPEATQPDDEMLAEEDLIAAVMAAGDPQFIQQFKSGLPAWSLDVVRYECVTVNAVEGDLAYEELRVTAPDGQVTLVAHQLLYCGGLGAYGLNGLFFSPDGKAFYFSGAREGVPDGAACGYWSKGTSRLILETLEIERLPGEGPLSPDGGQMLLWARSDFVLWDLDNGEIWRTANPYTNYSALSIAFNTEGTQVAVVVRQDCYRPQGDSAVLLLDLAQMTSRTVLESSDPGYIQATWESGDMLLLEDFSGDLFLLNLSTGEVTPAD